MEGSAPLTPNQRAGQTRKVRTRDRTLRALSELLGDVGYDDLRIASVARTAGVGNATLHQTFGSKAALVGELFSAEYESLGSESRAQLTRVPAPDLLLDHLTRLARLAIREPKLVSAYLRAYSSEILYRTDQAEVSSLMRPINDGQAIIDAGLRRHELPKQFALGNFSEALTLLVLSLVTRAAPDDQPAAADIALDLVRSMLRGSEK